MTYEKLAGSQLLFKSNTLSLGDYPNHQLRQPDCQVPASLFVSTTYDMTFTHIIHSISTEFLSFAAHTPVRPTDLILPVIFLNQRHYRPKDLSPR